jgi:endonuclease YncB( thermonuclease family)
MALALVHTTLAQVSADPHQVDGYVRAIQGDTLDARKALKRVGIGIVGVKAPSGNTACGREATAFVQRLVSDGVRLVEEPGLVYDERKRRMYHVETPDGTSIAEALVSAGLAQAHGRGSNRDKLVELEAAARTAGRGCLWSSGQ